MFKPCDQCGEATAAILGPVCHKCCKSNQVACNGKGKPRTETPAGKKYRAEYAQEVADFRKWVASAGVSVSHS